jgi:hypothetical protein
MTTAIDTILRGRILLAAVLVLAAASVAAQPASAASAGPGWSIRSTPLPTSLSTEPTGAAGQGYFLTIANVGTRASSGTVVIEDTLPAGVEVQSVPSKRARAFEPGNQEGGERVPCSATSSTTVRCEYANAVPPGGVIQVLIEVGVSASAGSAPLNHAEVEEVGGGEAAVARTESPGTLPTSVNAGVAAFGVQSFTVNAFGPAGERDTRAGDHPATVATSIAYNSVLDQELVNSPYDPVAEPKTETVDLPMGFVGDALSAPRCSEVALAAETCPADTRIGVIGIFKGEPEAELLYMYNVTPEAGYPAQFGFNLYETVVMLRPRLLPSSSGYVLSVPVPAVPRSEGIKVREVTVTFFGDPMAADGGPVGEAFATNPDACGAGPLSARMEMNSWVDPSDWVSAESPMFQASANQGVTGCGELQFAPTIQVAPTETTQTDTPSGYEVNLHVLQTPNFEGNLATPDLKNAVVTLPAGVSVSPGAANGLVACQASGPQGIELGNHDQLDADKLAGEGILQEGEEVAPDELVHPAPGHCPAASQIGTVDVETPLLPAHTLTGHVYVAAPECGNAGQPQCTPQSAEDGQLFGLYLEISGSGVIVKLRGQVSVNPSTGQLTTTFKEAPQLPFSELKLELNGGPRAPLANPQSCGTATTSSDLTPWSTPYTPDATPVSSFPVTGCTGGFAPGFLAQTTNSAAGVYSPFTLTFSRHDGEQDLSGLTVNMPQGLIGKIAGIAECGNGEVAAAEANTGGCPAASKVGTATAAAGAGSDPFWQSGSVYLTGPYNGAPFGLAVVVPANAGPFHLGNIIVRAAIHINPSTAAVTVVSNPLPQMIDGVPLRVQTVNVTVGEGDNFTFNPTNCAAASIGATISSAQGAAASVSAPFAATGCASLPFKPGLSVSTAGKASKSGGASLDVKVTSAAGQANIAKVDLQLPKQLPARLTTLQKACTEAQFNANPAGCPVASNIGSAVVRTPILSAPLAGPVYLVSHGGAAFPDVEIILQGEGVQIVLDGKTQNKHGITYNHFETVPDAPFESFETKLPTGKYSIFGTNLPEKAKYNLCGQSLSMPATITGQNGAVLEQTTKVGVTSCPKAKVAAKKKKKKQVKGKQKSKK